ncbi:MAG: amidohydrolase family protein [bacterium]|nr:amidohydrolase family protein [bacterium]
MELIDAHQHLYSEPNAVETLVNIAKKNGIKKVCLSACGEQYSQPGNDAVREAFQKYPEFIVGFGYIRLGIDAPSRVDYLYEEGFKGLKIINPRKPYNEKEYYPIYEKAAKYRMPILFHTGIAARIPTDKDYGTDSATMQPIYLDGIARAFPEIPIIGAHLGTPWFDEACCVAAMNPNVYFDLSWAIFSLVDKPPSFFDNLVYWKQAQSKLLFGVDAAYEKIPHVIEVYTQFMQNLAFSQELVNQILVGNIEKILGNR